MTRRELAAWLIVAFMAGSAVTPRSVSAQHSILIPPIWAVRSAIAHVCEVLATDHNMRGAHYDTARCWR